MRPVSDAVHTKARSVGTGTCWSNVATRLQANDEKALNIWQQLAWPTSTLLKHEFALKYLQFVRFESVEVPDLIEDSVLMTAVQPALHALKVCLPEIEQSFGGRVNIGVKAEASVPARVAPGQWAPLDYYTVGICHRGGLFMDGPRSLTDCA
jgi:hypothetical protein